jgi:hypothetical protein
VKLAKRIGARKACVAVARKLAIIMHRMRADETDFPVRAISRRASGVRIVLAICSAEDVGKVSPSRSIYGARIKHAL